MLTALISSRSASAWLQAGLVLLGAWLGGTAFAAERAPGTAQQTPAALYHNYCSVCHGDQGDGNSRAKGSLKPAPRDFTSAQAAQELSRDRMLSAVKNGIPNTAMVGWKAQLTEAEIAKVVDYIRDTFMRPSVAADASRGRQIYARVCSVCHGDRGNGSMWASANLNPAPRDFSSPTAKEELTRDRMITAVANGRPNTAMQGYSTKFSRAEVEAVVDYIRGAFMRIPEANAGISGTHARGAPAPDTKGRKGGKDEHAHHEHGGGSAADHAAHGHGSVGADGKVDMNAPFAGGLKGNFAAGQKFYDGNCATCHGVKGDGQGPRAYFINPKPAVFISPASRASFNRPTLFDATATGRRGSEMPAWDKVLTKQEIADVSEYVFRTFIRPAAGGTKVAKKVARKADDHAGHEHHNHGK
jgi:mono/diheme cytochrome c family protein